MSRLKGQRQLEHEKSPAEPGTDVVIVPGRADVPAPPESFGRGKPAKQDGDKKDEQREGKKEEKPPIYRRPWFWAIVAVVVIGGAIGAVLLYLSMRGKVSTDDAFVAAHVTSVSPRVSGHVVEVLVNDNQDVKKDQVLIRLDPTDLQQALQSAQAQQEAAQGQVEQAKSQVTVAQAQVSQAEADIAAAQASADQAQADLKRYEAADPRAISPQQLDAARAAYRTGQANLQAARQKQAAAQAQVALAQAQVQTAQDQLNRAKVTVEQARTQLSYTTIVAPEDGQIANRSVSVGDWVQSGQALMALVPPDIFIIANFKETELKDMKPGQKARIHVDAYGINLKGHVDSIQPGSGAAFSLLPPENATGNYVKIVQRVPVKIVLDEVPPHRLGPGMSVEPTVYARGKGDR